MYFYSKHFIIRIRILTASYTELSILNVDPIVKNVLFQPWCTAITTVHWFIITVILKLGEIYVEFLYCTIFNYWKFLDFGHRFFLLDIYLFTWNFVCFIQYLHITILEIDTVVMKIDHCVTKVRSQWKSLEVVALYNKVGWFSNW